MSLYNHCNKLCENDISYVSCEYVNSITIITVYQKLI